MDILNLNFIKDQAEIIDAFIEVYGKKNEHLIKENESNIIYTFFTEPECAYNYYNFLKNCMVKEACIKYLKIIGVLDPHFELRKSYQQIPEKINNLLNKYLDNRFPEVHIGFKYQKFYGICSFRKIENDPTNQTQNFIINSEQISYLNGLRDHKKPLITKDNYEAFKQTEEYASLYQQIQSYLPVFEMLNNELKNQLSEFSYLEDYYNEETEKYKKIYKLEILKLYDEIKSSIPKDLKAILDKKCENVEEKIDFLLKFDPNDEALIDNFSNETEATLKDPKTSEHKKRSILLGRTAYLEYIGTGVKMFDYPKYEEIISKDEIKKYLPSSHFVDYLIKRKNKCKKRAKRTCIHQNPLFKKCVNNTIAIFLPFLKDNLKELKSLKIRAGYDLCNLIINGNSCTFSISIKNDEIKKQYPVILQLVTKGDCAVIDHVFLHELTHALEFQDEFPNHKTGFDLLEVKKKNPYNKEYRLYERMNETITDMIIERVRKVLLKKGIYIADNRKLTDTKTVKNRNTDNLLKKMLYPLFDIVGQELLDARISGNIEEFITLIGTENFLNLNDSINLVDYLITKKELKTIIKKKNYNNPTFREYHSQLIRVQSIYEDINRRLQAQKDTNHKEYKKSL